MTGFLLRGLQIAWREPRRAAELIEYGYINRLRFGAMQAVRPVVDPIAKRALDRLKVTADLAAYNWRRSGAYEPDWFDLWRLYADVRKYKPRHVLEYGSGQSTLVLAKALHDNGSGHLTTLESEEHWANVNRTAIPEHLHPFVTIVHSPRRVLSRLEIRFSHAPVAAPDFVYLDGPDHPAPNMAALDLLDLERNFPQGFRLIIDGRTFNKNELLKRFKRKYRVRWRSPFSNDTVISLRS